MFRNDDNLRHKRSMDMALNGLDVLRDIELALVPLRPTDDMVDAGCKAAGLTPMQVQLVYESMVRATVSAFMEDDLL